MSEYKTLPGSKISFSLKIEEVVLKKSQERTLQHFQQEFSIPGFRKGHAPLEKVAAAIGAERLFMEALNKSVDEEYKTFLKKHSINPISSPKVDMKDFKKIPLEVEIEVEVFPTVNLGDYKKIKAEKVEVKVSEEERDNVIETLLAERQMGNIVDRAPRKGDLVKVDFKGKDEEGKVIPRTEGTDYTFRIGFQHMLPDLEKGIENMKKGEEKVVPVAFPKDYHSSNLSGKTIPFEVKLHEVFELSAKTITEDDIEKMTGKKKPVEEFKKEIETLIEEQKRNGELQKKKQEYIDKLVKNIKVELPQSWVENELQSRMDLFKKSPGYQEDPEAFLKKIGKKEADLQKEFHAEIEKDLKRFLSLQELIKTENIELDKDEMEYIRKEVQSMPPERQAYAFAEAMMESKIDKFFRGFML